ncbi:ABC transporter permease [Pukyongiella litopenaei]|uniref:ABC transporter permease n=1 Tax=Pukyongiella litopenaei TaxID=2605946 RepID=A0A2S0MNL3_9RHOB|nr:ABC transporter permease [Pukyongiella litopenaei]AVO37331.1 ABC transporter permease [Pukyongiella litopenaei]
MILLERRLKPADSPRAIAVATILSVLAALMVGGLLFLPYGANPISAYAALFSEAFLSWRGFGFTLIKATPLILVGLGTVVAWRTGFGYLGFEGCLLVGAAAATIVALSAGEGGALAGIPFVLFLPLATLAALFAGAIWSGVIGLFKGRFGGNEVITSLMMNYVAILLVQYLVSGPLRAPGGLPQTTRLERDYWLPLLFDGNRAHAGILIALAAAALVWIVLMRSRLGFEMIVTGLNPKAAKFGGIEVGRRQLMAACLAGGLAALAGMMEVLGVHHRLMDGMAEGTGFIGIVAALLGKLHPLGVVIVSLLYAGMTVGADAMQRQAGLPGSIVFMIQSMILLFILTSDLFRYYRLHFPGRGRTLKDIRHGT